MMAMMIMITMMKKIMMMKVIKIVRMMLLVDNGHNKTYQVDQPASKGGLEGTEKLSIMSKAFLLPCEHVYWFLAILIHKGPCEVRLNKQ